MLYCTRPLSALLRPFPASAAGNGRRDRDGAMGAEDERKGDGWSTASDAICVWKLTRRRDAEFSGEVSLCGAAAEFNRTGGMSREGEERGSLVCF